MYELIELKRLFEPVDLTAIKEKVKAQPSALHGLNMDQNLDGKLIVVLKR
jgi:hypothetical protein